MQTTTVETAEQLGLTADEFERIEGILGRTPNFTELSMYSVMWSEHCSYKNSIVWLKTLPRDGERLLVKAGEENAGLVDIGDGYACVFKIESHNHPSAIEPFQGAATGVGGIHRDIFTMGARPIAALNSLRFGNLKDKKTQHLVKGIVHGIGHYGNCFGVPTVAGETYFEDCYGTNPLVNAMSVGIVKVGQTVSATSHGVGNPVFIVGSATGKDGIGGASFASANITEESVEDLPAVQVGDPFQEKKLLEACLEIIPTGALVGMQDMGAAGITCSTAEMSAKGEHGMNIYLDKVPTRQENMKAWEMLLSESQERMLIVVHKGREEEVLRIFEKWDLHCVQIGEVTKEQHLKFYLNGELEADVPAQSLVLGGGAPQYHRAYTEPAYFEKVKAFSILNVSDTNSPRFVAERIAELPNIASKRWIYNQYDSMVGTANASTNAPSDAAIVLVKGSRKALAVTTDCNSRYVYADPHTGGQIAVAEAARNIVCSGGEPVAITNCLNFGNPYDPEVYYQFVHAIQGMGEACRKFNTPVTGGNVSFYNQSPDGAVYPTPTIGMLGVLDSLEQRITLDFKEAGHLVYLIGRSRNDINSSEYLHKILGVEHSPAPHFHLEEEAKLQQAITKLNAANLLQSAHDVSEGGLFITLLESAMAANIGFDIHTNHNFRKDGFLFGESQSRVVVTIRPEDKEAFESLLHTLVDASDFSVRHELLGAVKGEHVIVDGEDWGTIASWKQRYNTALESHLK
ncbi:phosphoribosylformylglycinamidine synthase subunit PurL [Chitinophaga pendula]|uniref:phosphoribosylformylglycinamidine synthase subunit PurL n=1 Tax=Chitinophaga TaxID=79328 RepID=UPI000BAF207E|nr:MULTISPECIES: phosphoribosylformylglycinamidine synthase subunit PurL [Chitinophaga]ASZ11359.1 phosphoribosylformylglycinamidine synthase II [Chitinophaga sp. MD30]UCJ05639.1 phosphoribosylformylglycinamidine synthase subunit PurL [Chitinophaga pendula]